MSASPGLYRHVKIGGIYEVVCNAQIEGTGEAVVVYRCKVNGTAWVRPESEFHDGRFVPAEDVRDLQKCCSQRGARLQILRQSMRETDWLSFVRDYPPAGDWFDDDGAPS